MDMQARLRNLAISDTGFLFDPYTGQTYSVNGTGRAILELLKQGVDVEKLRDRLAEQFESTPSDDMDRDVREFLLLLRDQGLVPRAEE